MCVLLGVLATPMIAAGQASRRGSITATLPLSVCVGVTDASGSPAQGLRRRDFQVVEGRTTRTVVNLARASSEPLTVGVLLQWSGTRNAELPHAELEPAASFFQAILGKGDVGFAAPFASGWEASSHLTGDPAVLKRYLAGERWARLAGPSALYDALMQESRVEIKLRRPGCRALVVVADGHDNASGHSLKDAIQFCLRARMNVYFVSLAEADQNASSRERGVLEFDARQIAEKTGGLALYVRSKSELADAFTLIANDLRNRYVLSFYPGTGAGGRGVHELQVGVDRPALRVLAPEGYFVPRK